MTLCPKSTRIFAVSLIVIGFAAAAGGQGSKTAQEIMDFSAAKSSDYKTWSADYTQTMNMMGTQMNMSGKMIQKQPRKIWLQMDMPMMGQQSKMTMVMGADGILWQAMDMGPQRQIMKIDMNKIASNSTGQAGSPVDPLGQMDPSKQWAASQKMFDYTVAKQQQVDGQAMYVMEGRWKKAALTNQQTVIAAAMIGSSKVFIGQKDGFLHRMEQFDKSGTNLLMAMEFKNLKFNAEVADSTFDYQPPPDAPVMDMTPMVEMQMRAKPATQTPATSTTTPRASENRGSGVTFTEAEPPTNSPPAPTEKPATP